MSGTGEETIRVLHVDDEPGFADVAAEFLEREHEALEVVTETSAGDGLERLESADVDCIVSDYDMPRMDGLDFLEAVRETDADLPFILFTGKGSEEIASDAISAGVTEYLQKETGTDQYAVLANRIERAVGEMRAREALQESERMLSTLISNLPGMVYRARNEPDWPMEFVSEGCQDLTGYAPEQLVAGEVQWGPDVLHPEDAGTMWEPVQEALDAGEPFEVTYRIETKDGETRWAWEQGRGVYEDGDVVALEGFVTDITERREVKQQLQQYEAIVESMPDGAFVVDDSERLQFVNEAAAAMLDRSAAEVVGDRVTDIAESIDDADRDRYEEAAAAIREGRQTQASVEVEVELPVGERTIDLRMRRLADDDVPGAVVGIARDLTEKTERDRELERYETVVQAVGDTVYALDDEGTFTFVNDAIEEVTGYAPEDLIGEHVSKVMETDDVRTGEAVIRDLLESDGETEAAFEMDLVGRDGERLPCENRIAILPFDEDGEFRGTAGIVRDISERKRRERDLEEYETLVENVGDPMYALDEDAVFTMVNEAMADHLDCTTDDIVGEHVTTVMDDEDVDHGTAVIAELIHDDDRKWETFEIETISFDGERKQTEDKVGILTDEDGDYTGSVGVIRDITERKQREQQLERYETIIQAVGDTVYALDADGHYTFVNDAIEEVTGYAPEELIGEHVSKVMDESDVRKGEAVIRELLKSDGESGAAFEMDIFHRDGGRVPHENRIALLPFDEDGEFRGTAGVVRDITERKQREQQLEQFASVVSHDLRNPLNVIKGRVELLQDETGGEHVDAIENAADRMERLIEDLLTLAQRGETVGESKPVDVARTAREAWEHVETGSATLAIADPGTVEADPDRLSELFENLFRNAVEHGRPDATVTVGGYDPPHADGSDADRPGGFYVADDGEGIDPDDRERVLEHGFSGSDDGTGIGLSIVASIVEAHGWTIGVTESADGGARFEIGADG